MPSSLRHTVTHTQDCCCWQSLSVAVSHTGCSFVAGTAWDLRIADVVLGHTVTYSVLMQTRGHQRPMLRGQRDTASLAAPSLSLSISFSVHLACQSQSVEFISALSLRRTQLAKVLSLRSDPFPSRKTIFRLALNWRMKAVKTQEDSSRFETLKV